VVGHSSLNCPEFLRLFLILLSRVSTGFLSNTFYIFIMQRKYNKMNAYLFLFYATTVNIPMGPYMPQNYSHGAYNL
jgi:hypothetical protein